jgi:hypothetical protein
MSKEILYPQIQGVTPSYLLQRPAGPLPYLGPLFSFLTHGHLALAGVLPAGRQPPGDGRRQSVTPAALPACRHRSPAIARSRPIAQPPPPIARSRPAPRAPDATAQRAQTPSRQPPSRRLAARSALPGARSACPAASACQAAARRSLRTPPAPQRKESAGYNTV